MKYLLDTHTFLWFLENSPQISKKAMEAIKTSSDVFVSIATLWEIEIKKDIGKLHCDYTASKLAILCDEMRISILPILPSHIETLSTLPLIHKDPFDRMIIAQSELEEMTLITRDTIIPKYPNVLVLW